jgi:hypothetical protein
VEKSSLRFLYEDSKCSIIIFEVFFTQIGARIYIVTTFRAGRFEVRIAVQARDFALFQNVHTDSVHQTASYSMGAGVLSPRRGGGESGRGVKLTSYFRVVLKLRMSGTILYSPCMPSWSTHGQHNVFTCRQIATKNTVQNILRTCVHSVLVCSST